MIVGQALDTHSTVRALHRGCLEGNPVLQAIHITTPRRIMAMKAGVVVSLTYQFGKHPSPFGKVLTGALGASGMLISVRNYHLDCQ